MNLPTSLSVHHPVLWGTCNFYGNFDVCASILKSNASTPLISLPFCRKLQNHLTVPINQGKGGGEKAWLLLTLYNQNGEGPCWSHLCLLLPVRLSLLMMFLSRQKQPLLPFKAPLCLSLHLLHCLYLLSPSTPWVPDALSPFHTNTSYLRRIFVSVSFQDWLWLFIRYK